MGIWEMMRWKVALALCAAILVVGMPSAHGMSESSESVADLAEDLGNGVFLQTAVAPKPKVAKAKATTNSAKKSAGASTKAKAKSKAKAKAAQRKEKKSMKAVEKLLKNPIVDPQTEKAYKAAAISVAKSKKKIMSKLQGVEAILILTKRVNEKQAKKAAALATAAGDNERDAAAAMERAHKTRIGCVDIHTGLCLGVKIQGHCGIADYANSCKLSCHLCTNRHRIIMGSPREKKRKKEVERAGKHAARKKKRQEKRKVAEKNSKANKAKETKKKDVQKNKALKAAEKKSKAKEKLKKDKAKIAAKKVSDDQVKFRKERAKKEAARVKREKAGEKKAKKAQKAAAKRLKALRKRKGKYDAAMEKVQKAKKKLA